MEKFKYYENGSEETFTLEQVKQIFQDVVDDAQKEQGTTFETWLDEMEHMQILIRTE